MWPISNGIHFCYSCHIVSQWFRSKRPEIESKNNKAADSRKNLPRYRKARKTSSDFMKFIVSGCFLLNTTTPGRSRCLTQLATLVIFNMYCPAVKYACNLVQKIKQRRSALGKYLKHILAAGGFSFHELCDIHSNILQQMSSKIITVFESFLDS